MRSAEARLRTEGLACGYGSRAVLSDVTLTFQPGETVALLGPNGSGKSTLLKTLSGALRPMVGRVELAGRPVGSYDARARAREVAYVPQREDPALDFTLRETVVMGRYPYADGLFENEADRKAAEAAMIQADCAHLANRPMSTLSGGEAQRALIARALAQAAPVMLLDEPTTHLDVAHQIAIGRLLCTLAESGRTVIAAVHDLNWALAVASRVVLLGRGQVRADGPPEQLYDLATLREVYDVPFVRTEGPGAGWVFPAW